MQSLIDTNKTKGQYACRDSFPEEEVLTCFDKLSKWDPGAKETSGAHLISYRMRRPNKQLHWGKTQKGKTTFLARTTSWEATPYVSSMPIHYMVESGEGWASEDKVSA